MKKIALKKNLCSGAPTVLIGVFLMVIPPYNIKSKVNTVTSAVGPAYLPRLVICGMISCGICLLLTSLVLKKDETLEIGIGWEGHAVLYFVLLLFYMFTIKYVGSLIASVIFSAVSMRMMEDRDQRYHLFVESLVIMIFVSFKYSLYVILPTIIL